MKFLEYPSLARLNGFLGRVDVGNYVLTGEIEAYSCKLAGMDKKLSKSLDQEVVNMIAASPSPSSYSTSPVGPLTDQSSRKTLIYLILTLNHMYPDYDFSTLRAHHFSKEVNTNSSKNDIDSLLLETAQVWAQQRFDQPFLEALWAAIDEVVVLGECDLYSYRAQVDEDPFSEEGNLWSFTVFFYNRKQKRILCFSCRAVSKSALEESEESDEDMHPMDDGDDDMLGSMEDL